LKVSEREKKEKRERRDRKTQTENENQKIRRNKLKEHLHHSIMTHLRDTNAEIKIQHETRNELDIKYKLSWFTRLR